MKMSKFAVTALFSGVLTLAVSGAALASDATISNTGPDSDQQITIENSNHFEVSNDNNLTVTNTNTQDASTGDATVKENTTAGDAMSGQASNNNTVTTDISIDNQTAVTPGGGQGGGEGGQGSGGGSGGLGGGSGAESASSTGGLGGGSGSSVDTLPDTGAHLPIDVSALRNLLSHASDPLVQAVKPNPMTSGVLMAVAIALSLIGAIGAGVLSTKRTLRV